MSASIQREWARDGVISGVCAQIAHQAGVPVWMPRVAFVIFFVLHWFFAVVTYVVLAKLFCGRAPGWRACTAPPAPPMGGLHGTFSALDERLANLEAATLQQEAALRRAFREMDRK